MIHEIFLMWYGGNMLIAFKILLYLLGTIFAIILALLVLFGLVILLLSEDFDDEQYRNYPYSEMEVE